jgi:hypothetical protein
VTCDYAMVTKGLAVLVCLDPLGRCGSTLIVLIISSIFQSTSSVFASSSRFSNALHATAVKQASKHANNSVFSVVHVLPLVCINGIVVTHHLGAVFALSSNI